MKINGIEQPLPKVGRGQLANGYDMSTVGASVPPRQFGCRPLGSVRLSRYSNGHCGRARPRCCRSSWRSAAAVGARRALFHPPASWLRKLALCERRAWGLAPTRSSAPSCSKMGSVPSSPGMLQAFRPFASGHVSKGTPPEIADYHLALTLLGRTVHCRRPSGRSLAPDWEHRRVTPCPAPGARRRARAPRFRRRPSRSPR